MTYNSPTQINLNVTVPFSAATGPHTLTVTNPDGQSVTSAASFFEVACLAEPPAITQQLATRSVCINSPVTFEVLANSPTAISFQWRKDGNPIDGATSNTFHIDAVTEEELGAYDVVLKNECAEITANAASLNLIKPEIIGNPDALISHTCDMITFSVVVDGPMPFSYQWRRDGAPLTDDDRFKGTQTIEMIISPLSRSDIGIYDVVVTTGCGEIVSNPVDLTIKGVTKVDDCPQGFGVSSAEAQLLPCALCGAGSSAAMVLSIAGWGLWRRPGRRYSNHTD